VDLRTAAVCRSTAPATNTNGAKPNSTEYKRYCLLSKVWCRSGPNVLLRELETRIDDESMKISSSFRIVLPMAVLELPARFAEFKRKSDAAAKKINKLKAFQAAHAQRRVDELRSQLDTDENDDKDPAVKTCDPEDSRSRTLEVMPRIEFESRVEETASVKAAFHDDVKLVTTALSLSGEQVRQLEI
jgi:hypothetical protein